MLTVFAVALKDIYGLNELQIGLCYLPCGVATIMSSLINGRQLDFFFRREERRVGGDYRTHKEFRIEITRIRYVTRAGSLQKATDYRCLYPLIAIHCIAAIGLGWSLQARTPLAVVLVFMFFVGLGTGSISTATIYGQVSRALVMCADCKDILPGKGT